MTPDNEERRPAGNGTALTNTNTIYPESTESTCCSSRPCLSLADLDALAERVRGCFVVVVAKPSLEDAGRIVRRPYLTAKAAEAAANKAVARGEQATVYLAELHPIHRIGGAR